MTQLTGVERAAYVQSMFARIAGRYDLMNRLMTGGQDVAWRRQVIQIAQHPPGGKLLVLGPGAGALALEALRLDASLRAVGGDFTLDMMGVGRTPPNGGLVRWAGADA